jgi:hypothetical protein
MCDITFFFWIKHYELYNEVTNDILGKSMVFFLKSHLN